MSPRTSAFNRGRSVRMARMSCTGSAIALDGQHRHRIVRRGLRQSLEPHAELFLLELHRFAAGE